MTREDHQPTNRQIERPKREVGELHRVCGSSVGIVLAFDESTTPLIVNFEDPDEEPIVCAPVEDGMSVGDGKPVARPVQMYKGKPAVCWAVDAMRASQMTAVFVVTSPALSTAVSHAVYGTKRKGGGSNVQVVEIDRHALVERTRLGANFEMFGLPFGMLELARGLADSLFEGYDNVVILESDAVRITPGHLYELCLDAMEHPEVEAVPSWIECLRRSPFLFTRDFLHGLEERGIAAVGPNGFDRPVPLVKTRDHVFGDELLAPSPAEHPVASAFLDECTIGALEALQLARAAENGEGDGGESADAVGSPAAIGTDAAGGSMSDADRELVAIAQGILHAREANGDRNADLVWADEFGRRCKLDFPLLNDRWHKGKLAYLDSAATCQRVDVSLQAQRDFDEHANANVYRGGYELSKRATDEFGRARRRIEEFIGSDEQRIAFTANTTGAANLVAQAWGEWNIGEGDLIVIPLAEHHSNMLPFTMLAERKRAEVEFVPYGPDGRLDQQAFSAALERRPKLVCAALVGNVFGIVEPVREMAKAAHEVGARFLVDAAQALSHMKLDVKDLGADWVTMSGHKGYGPFGIGALWIGDEAFDEMDPLGGGGGVVTHVGVGSYRLRPRALQYEMGTPPLSQAIAWAAACDYLDGLGMDAVARHDCALTRYLVRGLHMLDGVNVVGDHDRADGQVGLVSFTVRDVLPAELAAFAGRLGVDMRSGGHCALPLHASVGLIGTGRISFGVHTTSDDIDAALVAIEACRRAYER